jgi:hypothetical protein
MVYLGMHFECHNRVSWLLRYWMLLVDNRHLIPCLRHVAHFGGLVFEVGVLE